MNGDLEVFYHRLNDAAAHMDELVEEFESLLLSCSQEFERRPSKKNQRTLQINGLTKNYNLSLKRKCNQFLKVFKATKSD